MWQNLKDIYLFEADWGGTLRYTSIHFFTFIQSHRTTTLPQCLPDRVAILGALYTRAWGPMGIEIYKLIRRKGQDLDLEDLRDRGSLSGWTNLDGVLHGMQSIMFCGLPDAHLKAVGVTQTGTSWHFKISQPLIYYSLLRRRAYMTRMAIESLQIHHASEEGWILDSSQFLSPPPRRTATHPNSKPQVRSYTIIQWTEPVFGTIALGADWLAGGNYGRLVIWSRWFKSEGDRFQTETPTNGGRN